MKEYLIKKHLTTRSKIDYIAKQLSINPVGSRASLLLQIKQKPYSQILKCIEKM